LVWSIRRGCEFLVPQPLIMFRRAMISRFTKLRSYWSYWNWILGLVICLALTRGQLSAQSYIGFDRNEYPGDATLKTLHQTFAYTGYWLNNPPGMNSNGWRSHRAAVESAGLGFLVLFNGRLYADLKNPPTATRLGKSDAQAAINAAKQEG